MVFIVFYFFAMIGMELFGGYLVPTNPFLKGTDYAALGYFPMINFNTFPNTMITLFRELWRRRRGEGESGRAELFRKKANKQTNTQTNTHTNKQTHTQTNKIIDLLIVNNWHITLLGTIAATQNKASAIYFFAFYLFTVIVLMNLVVAFFLEIFQMNWDIKQAEFERKAEERRKKLSGEQGQKEEGGQETTSMYSIFMNDIQNEVDDKQLVESVEKSVGKKIDKEKTK